ncbi:hypothetical protein [Paenibacillus sp. UNC451MF]|uniref:hypothetical protein n=1 Tax=Paenibacillus sp. UNC451MF TaxID=1449063 RepID=UPI00068C9541|nr:hypothetical protein [Paenibacillus sp. UNC451MF]
MIQKHWNIKLSVFISVLLLLCSSNQASCMELSSRSSTYLLKTEKADLTGDSVPETIVFSGTKLDPTTSYYDKLNIRIVSSSDSKSINIISAGGYNPTLQLQDYNGDQISDIYISASQGNNQPASLSLYTILDEQAVPIPLPPPLNIKGTLKDNYKAPVTIHNTNQRYVLDLVERKTSYEAIGYYQNGRLLQPASMIINGYNALEPIDWDRDGIGELRGIQRIMLPNDETIALAHSIWKWRYNQWTLVRAKVVSHLNGYEQ